MVLTLISKSVQHASKRKTTHLGGRFFFRDCKASLVSMLQVMSPTSPVDPTEKWNAENLV